MNRPLLNQAGFLNDKTPYLRNITNDTEEVVEIVFNQPTTITFDVSEHYCIGWRDIATGKRYPCERHNKTEPKYEQCKECMDKTGFNPAFYNTTEVSAAQADYNAQAHIVYLAYFDTGIIKVGITNAQRKFARLLEQGARQAIVIDTFPSANVARKYEADISKLGFAENLLLSRKINLLKNPYDSDEARHELEAAQQQIEDKLQTKFEQAQWIDLNPFYFSPDFDQKRLANLIDVADQAKISGQIKGMVGSILICENSDNLLALPLKKFTGYFYDRNDQIEEVDTPAQQFSLF